jgi:hypothetical protein
MPDPATQPRLTIGPGPTPELNGQVGPRPHLGSGVWGPKSKPHVRLAQGKHQNLDTIRELAGLMHDACGWLNYGGSIARPTREPFGVRPISPAEAVTELEHAAFFYKVVVKHGEAQMRFSTINAGTAAIILNADAMKRTLPRVRMLSRCPVMIVRDGELEDITGFDRESGIYVHPDALTPMDVPFSHAMDYLNALLADFHFATDGDRARAVAALITPAIMRSGLLDSARGPIDILEANDSQAGKGFFVRMRAAIYADTPHTITQREGGVGSLGESIMSAIVAAPAFVSIDNVRGPVNCATLESALTEKSVECRIPHRGSIYVDPSPITFSLTSNGAELTIDLANRSNIIRLLKQPPEYRYREWPEGGLLEHVRENQPWYLGAVWSIVREWHDDGCPVAKDVREHDLDRWARAIRYIVRDMLGLADPLADYRAIQKSKATPALIWLRAVLLAVKRANKFGLVLRAHDIFGVCVEHGVEVPGLTPNDAQREDDSTRTKALQGIGRRLASAFSTSDTIDVDGVPVRRIQRRIERDKCERTYVFGSMPGGPVPDGSAVQQMELPV